MNTYTIDASFVLGAILEQEKKLINVFSDIFAEVIAKRAIVYSSQLLPLEVANVIKYEFKDEKAGIEAYEKFCRLPICYFTLDGDQIKQVLSLAYSTSGSVYDASYHLVAKLQGAELLTCDKKYYLKAEKFGNIKLVG